MRYVEKRITNGELKLIPIGDIHLGDPTSDVELLKGTLDYVKHSRNCFILGMGDYLNCATKSSVSDVYTSTMSPQEEYETIIDFFEPVKDRILGLLVGNHEQRIQKESGVDVVKAMSKELHVPYLGWSSFVRLKVNKQNYVVFAMHGSTSATTLEGKIRSLRKIMDNFVADVYLMGHVHELQLPFVDEVYYVDFRNKCIKKRKRYGLFTGHFLDYSGSYAEMKALRPAKRGVPKIKLFGDRWDVHVSL